MQFLVGGYTADGGGIATGIGLLDAGEPESHLTGGALGFRGDVAETGGSPSWITQHPLLSDVIYAGFEVADTVQAYRRTGPATYVPLGAPVATGRGVCHVAVAPDGASLIASCWGDGAVIRMATDAAGIPHDPITAPAPVDPFARSASPEAAGADPLDPAALSAAGIDLSTAGNLLSAAGLDLSASGARPLPDAEYAAAARALREAAGEEYAHLLEDLPSDEPSQGSDAAPSASDRVPHAHQSVFVPHAVITTDMGFDLVRIWRNTPAGLKATGEVVLPRGSGPRHAVWHPSGHLYVVTELSCEVFVLAPDASGTWRLVGGTPLIGAQESDYAAGICLSRDAEFVYVGVRGSNTIATLRVRGAGESLQMVALSEAGVNWPRFHTVERDTLLVAGERSNEVASSSLDSRTGVPGRVRFRAAAPSPTCLIPLPAG